MLKAGEIWILGLLTTTHNAKKREQIKFLLAKKM